MTSGGHSNTSTETGSSPGDLRLPSAAANSWMAVLLKLDHALAENRRGRKKMPKGGGELHC